MVGMMHECGTGELMHLCIMTTVGECIKALTLPQMVLYTRVLFRYIAYDVWARYVGQCMVTPNGYS